MKKKEDNVMQKKRKRIKNTSGGNGVITLTVSYTHITQPSIDASIPILIMDFT